MARKKGKKRAANHRGKAAPKKARKKVPTFKLPAPSKPAQKPRKGVRKAAQKPAQKPARKPRPVAVEHRAPVRKAAQKPAQRPRKAAAKKRARKAPKKLSRAYEGRLRRAQLVADALGLDAHQIKNIARGHPDRAKGELGLHEVRYLKAAARLPSQGQQRQAGETRPVHYELRAIARTRLADALGLSAAVPDSSPSTRRSAAAERFAEAFAALGLGSLHDGYTLWFSP